MKLKKKYTYSNSDIKKSALRSNKEKVEMGVTDYGQKCHQLGTQSRNDMASFVSLKGSTIVKRQLKNENK